MEIMQVAGRKCHIFRWGREEKIIYWGIQCGQEEMIRKVAGKLSALVGKVPFVLVAYETENWNQDFSPWMAAPVFGENGFSGDGEATLKWILESCIPVVEESCHYSFPPGKRLLAGYSLAGLFSLWVFYESNQFGGAASCSGSLWFPEWREYISAHRSKSKGSIYLSLGKKEEKTRNAVMAQIGEITKLQYERMQNDERIEHSILEYYPGGHFYEVENRIAQGIAWLIRNS